ncbi:aminoglycoside phosphotransferase [Paenibacillus curdlanolyticus YK9]|uniref:Aminoglycoside phosphotransferase n=1 Tax=Paenibacillus curdlanolyticus YK9 TaxID=717606 RepID=E0IG34_9BACL|nr:aminoglycoside phosphotransferase family protein [Paenibacillus curdlanolyticus]EFM08614.1 aminoglycoside phosphotransferase [Paenibacillus curdlanolyticus YK9]
MSSFQTNENVVPEQAQAWVLQSIGKGAEWIASNRLKGGVSAAVYGVTLRVGEDSVRVVLRLFDNEDWLRQEPDLARHEGTVLEWVSRTDATAPQLIAYDETGSLAGMPAVLMSHLPGAVDLMPIDQAQWLDELAAALSRIHLTDANDLTWAYFTYQDVSVWEMPTWSVHTNDWAQIQAIVRGPRPAFDPVFIHRDYHPTNVLWEAGKISGVVDWVNACIGPAGVDVGHCRMNLALLFGTAAADQFLEAYLRHAGERFRYDPYWDVITMANFLYGPPGVYPGWTALGVSGLTDALMAERTDHYMKSLLQRL